jgi:GntR family transcriptional regulator
VQTLRRSVQQLVDEGLLDRRHGSGTYVSRPSFDSSLFRWFNFEDAAGGPKTVPESRLLERSVQPVPAHVCGPLGVSPASKVVHILRVRLWAQEPIVVEDLYLPYPKYAGFVDLDEREIGNLLYPAYERLFGDIATSVTDEVSIGYASAQLAKLMRIAVKDPVVHVDRTTHRADGSAMEWRRAYGRADRFRYRVTL